jgi:hypothetical protein
MSVSAAMSLELTLVSESLDETVGSLEKKITPDRREEFDHNKTAARAAQEQKKRLVAGLEAQAEPGPDSASHSFLCTYIDILTVTLPPDGKLFEQEREVLRSLRNQSERVDRKIQLLHPASEQEFIGSLYWMSQQGVGSDRDLIFNVAARTPFPGGAASHNLLVAEQEIIKREHHELYRFFGLSPSALAHVIKATMEERWPAGVGGVPCDANAERPTEVVNWLREISATLEGRFSREGVIRWLQAPSEAFGGRTPSECLLEGKTWLLVQHLRAHH